MRSHQLVLFVGVVIDIQDWLWRAPSPKAIFLPIYYCLLLWVGFVEDSDLVALVAIGKVFMDRIDGAMSYFLSLFLCSFFWLLQSDALLNNFFRFGVEQINLILGADEDIFVVFFCQNVGDGLGGWVDFLHRWAEFFFLLIKCLIL